MSIDKIAPQISQMLSELHQLPQAAAVLSQLITTSSQTAAASLSTRRFSALPKKVAPITANSTASAASSGPSGTSRDVPSLIVLKASSGVGTDEMVIDPSVLPDVLDDVDVGVVSAHSADPNHSGQLAFVQQHDFLGFGGSASTSGAAPGRPQFQALLAQDPVPLTDRYFLEEGQSIVRPAPSVEELERQLKEQPAQPALWLQYLAACPLVQGKSGLALTDARLSVLVKALESNQHDESLWLAFLAAYQTKASPAQYLSVLCEATRRVPTSVSLWKLAVDASPSVLEKAAVLEQAVGHLLRALASASAQQRLVDRMGVLRSVVDLVCRLAALWLQAGQVVGAASASEATVATDDGNQRSGFFAAIQVFLDCFRPAATPVDARAGGGAHVDMETETDASANASANAGIVGASVAPAYRGLAWLLPTTYRMVLAVTMLLTVVHRTSPLDPWRAACPDTAFVIGWHQVPPARRREAGYVAAVRSCFECLVDVANPMFGSSGMAAPIEGVAPEPDVACAPLRFSAVYNHMRFERWCGDATRIACAEQRLAVEVAHCTRLTPSVLWWHPSYELGTVAAAATTTSDSHNSAFWIGLQQVLAHHPHHWWSWHRYLQAVLCCPDSLVSADSSMLQHALSILSRVLQTELVHPETYEGGPPTMYHIWQGRLQ
jgi:hypothetical protein